MSQLSRLARAVSILVAIAAGLGPFSAGAAAQSTRSGAESTEVRIPRIERAPTLEEFLDMRPPARHAAMAHVTGFTQQVPEDGQPASQKTDVYLGYDDERLYVVFVAFDDERELVRAHMERRERIFNDDTVEIMLDTFDDGQHAFAFLTNPLGVQWDAIWTEGNGFDQSWDAVWDSRGRLTDRGYVVWMSIPFSSLRFRPDGEQIWRMVFVRDIVRNNETSFWPHVSGKIDGRLNQAGRLTGLRDISPGRNMQIVPYASGLAFRTRDAAGNTIERESLDADGGVDAKFVLRDSLALDLTVNPDFSQVETDSPQATINERFEVFFPEKRPFFLENASFFNTPFNLLFTRRIFEPRGGARLTGKVGNYSVGALAIDDECPRERQQGGSGRVLCIPGPRAEFGVARVRRELPRQSYVGAIFTERRFGDDRNRVGGVDGRIRLDDTWSTRFQAVWSESRIGGLETSDPAFNLEFNRSSRTWSSHNHWLDIGRDFRTDTGFVNRVDVSNLHSSNSYAFRPEGRRLVRWEPSIFVSRIEDQAGVRLDESISPGISFELRRQISFGLTYVDARERLREVDWSRFGTIGGTPGESIDYERDELSVFFNSRFWSWLQFNVRHAEGQGINFAPPEATVPLSADLAVDSLSFEIRMPGGQRVDVEAVQTEIDQLQSGRRALRNRIVRARWNWQMTRALSLRTILRWDDTSVTPTLTRAAPGGGFNADLLATYLVNPWTALYVGYNSNAIDDVERVDVGGPPEYVNRGQFNNARQVFVKMSYLLPF